VSVYRFISAEKARTPVSLACQWLGVSRSGYYEWATRVPSQRALTDAWLTERIRAIHEAHRGVYGAPRIHADLRLAHGVRVSCKRVERLMRAAGISGLVRRKRGRTTIRVPGVRVADDLVERRFGPTAPNVLWIADVTYLRTWEGGSPSPPSRMPTAAESSAGRWPTICAQSLSSTRSRWRSRADDRRPA
jgi:putative transposase